MSATLSPVSYALTMSGRSKTDLLLLVASSVVLVALCIPLTLAFGITGAAAAVLAAFALLNALRLVVASRFLGIRLGRWRDAVPPPAALALGMIANQLFVPEAANLLHLLPGCFVYALAYCALMFGKPALARARIGRDRAVRGIA